MYYVYIAYQKSQDQYQIGSSIDLKRRIHTLNIGKDTDKIDLVYYEIFDNSDEAEKRENFLNNLSKEVLDELVKESNPLQVNLIEILKSKL